MSDHCGKETWDTSYCFEEENASHPLGLVEYISTLSQLLERHSTTLRNGLVPISGDKIEALAIEENKAKEMLEYDLILSRRWRERLVSGKRTEGL
jgi:hypothetical protein